MSHMLPLLAAPLPLVLPFSPLLSGWLLCCCLSSRRRVPCQRLSLRRCLSVLRSCPSCPAGCRIDSPHGAVSHLLASLPGGLGPCGRSLWAAAFSSHRALVSCSAALMPLVWLVVALPLLTPSNPLPAPPPLVAPSPLVPLLLRLLSGWLLHRRPPRLPTPAPPTSRERGAARARPAPITGRGPPPTTLRTAPPAPALIPPGGGISKLLFCGRDTGLEGWEQRCRRRTACRGAVGDVIVVNHAVKHPPRPHLRTCAS